MAPKRYPTDVTAAHWAQYVLRSGCPWRLLPQAFLPWAPVYHYFRQWRDEGGWKEVLPALRRQERQRRDRAPDVGGFAVPPRRWVRCSSAGCVRLHKCRTLSEQWLN